MNFLDDLLGGWKETRAIQGFSYQVARDGRRRIVPIEDYGRRTSPDAEWLLTGQFEDERMQRRFRDYNLAAKARKRMERKSRRTETPTLQWQ